MRAASDRGFPPHQEVFMTDDTTSLTRRQGLKAGGVTFAGYAMAPDRALADAITTDTQGLVAGEAEVPIGGYKLPVYEARPATGGNDPPRDLGDLGRPLIRSRLDPA